MESKQCFEQGCEFEVEYACQCTSPQTLFCEQHFVKHYKLPNRDHKVESIFVEPCEGTKEAILGFLTKEKSKHSKLKRSIAASFSQRLFDSEHDIKELLKNLDSYSAEISKCFTKISQTNKLSKSEQDPILRLLSSHPDEAVEKVKTMIPANPDWYNSAKVFCGFSEKIEKIIESFIKDKFETYLDKRLLNIESTLEEHNKMINSTNEEHSKAINLANNELANVKDALSKLINENKKCQIELEDWKKVTENEVSLLYSQMTKIAEELNRKLKKAVKLQHSEHINAILQELRDKTSEILNRPNDSELEQEFKSTCSMYESDASLYDPPLKKAYQDYTSAYHKKASLYIFRKDNANRTNLFVYDTESGREETKVLETMQPLDYGTCTAQLPNGKLFCFGNLSVSGITMIIDRHDGFRQLPSGIPCYSSSVIYFNRNVYCFGGRNNGGYLTLSGRFDLDENRWINLTPMLQADQLCSSIITNGNILISGYQNRNLLQYSIGSNKFSTIPFQFAANKRKILIKVERSYLIECIDGSIYESEISNDTAWRQIGTSIISNLPYQVYCSYNNGGINIACCDNI